MGLGKAIENLFFPFFFFFRMKTLAYIDKLDFPTLDPIFFSNNL